MKLPSEVKREIFVRKEGETDYKYGFFPDKRPIELHINNSVINLDKPRGPTSHQVAYWVKKIIGAKKIGHGGTLDPAVTGILPIGVNNATKILGTLIYAGKEYVALIHLHKDAEEEKIKETLESFVGEIEQLPPVRSKVKRVVRKRKVYYIEFLEKKDKDILIKVGVQHGTYIRRLAEQIGDKLGVGAHLIQLRRTKAGGFSEEDNLVTLQDVEDAFAFWKEDGNEKFLRYCLQPMENAVRHLPKIWVFDNAVDSLCHGAKLAVPGVSKFEYPFKEGDVVAIETLKGELIALGIALTNSEELKEAKKGLVARVDRVTMPIGMYPK